jgi:hypothetical protein
VRMMPPASQGGVPQHGEQGQKRGELLEHIASLPTAAYRIIPYSPKLGQQRKGDFLMEFRRTLGQLP